MAAYSLTQYASVIQMYEIDSNLTDFEYLYIDLALITTFAFFFGQTRAYKGEKRIMHSRPTFLLKTIDACGFNINFLQVIWPKQPPRILCSA